MVFPLLYSSGDLDWSIGYTKSPNAEENKQLTTLQYYLYRLSYRPNEKNFSPLLFAGRLTQQYFFQHSVREVRFPTCLAKSVCSKSNFPHVVLKSYVRYMFGKEILVSCAFPPSLRSGVNITRDVNLLSRTCIVMYY